MSVKPFAEHGHYTPVHDTLFDDVMPICPPNAWKVLCFVLRKTRGWQKDSDRLSYTQIREGSGIGSDTTVSKALAWLTHEEHPLLISETQRNSQGRQGATLYGLNREFSIAHPSTETVEPPTTETVDGSATETVVGPSTETVETEKHPREQETYIDSSGATATENVAIDDTTTTCLRTLKTIPGFPRDEAANAIKVAEYREEFPNADPVEVCRDLKAWLEEHPQKKASRLRLRNFFKTAERQANRSPSNVRSLKSRRRSIAVTQADLEDDYDDFSFFAHERAADTRRGG